jgi:hypothetical protein
MADVIQVVGLKQAKENFKKLDGEIKTNIGRSSIKEALLVIVRAIKARTYTTFRRRSGFIKKGFGVVVYKTLKNERLDGRVVQYPQSALGGGYEQGGVNPGKFRQSAFRKGKWEKNPDKLAEAFWWRFLEEGAGLAAIRKSVPTPKGTRISKKTSKKNIRTRRALARYEAAKSLGKIRARPWVRPAVSSSVDISVGKFTNVIREMIVEAAKNLPK